MQNVVSLNLSYSALHESYQRKVRMHFIKGNGFSSNLDIEKKPNLFQFHRILLFHISVFFIDLVYLWLDKKFYSTKGQHRLNFRGKPIGINLVPELLVKSKKVDMKLFDKLYVRKYMKFEIYVYFTRLRSGFAEIALSSEKLYP